MCMCLQECGGHKMTQENEISASDLLISGMELRLYGLGATAFTCQALSVALLNGLQALNEVSLFKHIFLRDSMLLTERKSV